MKAPRRSPATSPDPFFRTDPHGHGDTLLTCSLGCPEARRGNFCGARIEPECLRLDRPGSVRVGLSATPEAWFKFLSGLGETLHSSRNPIAELQQVGMVPAVDDWTDPVLPVSTTGLFAPNLAEHARLWAVRESSDRGPIHGLEMEDAAGFGFHRVFLTASSRRDRYEEFVTQHQSPPDEAEVWCPPNHASSTQRLALWSSRVEWFQRQVAERNPEVRRLTPGFPFQLFHAVVRARLPVRTMVTNNGHTLGSIWTPSALEEYGGPWNSGDSAGGTRLCLNGPALGSTWLWRGACTCGGTARWSVEIADRFQCLRLAILAGADDVDSEWRAMLQALTD